MTGCLLQLIFKSFIRYSNQINSQVAVDNALYSASEDDLETVTCFFAFHETREEPKKKQYPEVDLLVSKQPAQSASENPRIWKSEILGNNKPLPVRYLTTLQAAL
jgi:hypothetical protein